MSTLDNGSFNTIVTSGLDNAASLEYGIETAVDETSGFQDLASTTGPNPQVEGSDFTQSGTTLNGSGSTWESDASQSVNQLRVRVEIVSGGGVQPLFIWNNGGNGFGQSLQNGEDLTLENYGINCQRAGIAEAMQKGNSNLTDHVYLLDGNSNRITTGGGWADASAPKSFTATDNAFAYQNTVSFTNPSGSQTVDGVEVHYEASNNRIIEDTSFNVTLGGGDTLELTTLQANLTLP